ncbi:hydrolase [Devosia pacifica]|uniref:Hydrolase n=1 Tax=Devosia pacifica TaxID=1335967 RepID=A0A918S2X5_9HYPH|nr:amidohydrolase family protein [Devosia pacifica]GHA18195.1 hydrolase [Devosia pacifica]
MTSDAEPRQCLPPHPIARTPRQRLPEGTCDCHFHVFAEGAPLVTPRSYTPQVETLDGWRRLADTAGIERGVLVQPSVYGQDNSVLLDALASAPDALRGVVVIHPETSPEEFSRLDAAGVRAVRVNLRNKSGLGLEAVPALERRMQPLGWHFVFQVGPETLTILEDMLPTLSIPVVIDHLAFVDPTGPDAQKHLARLKRLLETGQVYCKLSAPYRLAQAPHYDGFGTFVRALAETNPDRLLWGSDWPHTELFDTVPDDTDLLDAFDEWVPPSLRQRLFVDTPQSLYWSRP